MPHKLGRYQLLCSSCPRVRQRVYCVEYFLPPAFWHYRSRYSCRNVTQQSECSIFEGDVFYTEVSNSGAIVLDIWVILLIGSHGPVVQPRFDGIYGFERNTPGSLLTEFVQNTAPDNLLLEIVENTAPGCLPVEGWENTAPGGLPAEVVEYTAPGRLPVEGWGNTAPGRLPAEVVDRQHLGSKTEGQIAG